MNVRLGDARGVRHSVVCIVGALLVGCTEQSVESAIANTTPSRGTTTAAILATPSVTAAGIDAYLTGKASPLTGTGAMFVSQGSLFNVDPRLVVAIAGAETTFGQRVCTAFNAWNWFFNGPCPSSSFLSWDDGITTVTKFLRLSYLNQGFTSIPTIESKYCASGCPFWIPNVTQFFQQDLGGDPANLAFPAASVTVMRSFDRLCLDPATPGVGVIGVCGSIMLQTVNPPTGGTAVTIRIHSDQGSLGWNDANTSSAVNNVLVFAPGWGSIVGGLAASAEGPVVLFGTRTLGSVFTIQQFGAGFGIVNYSPPSFSLQGGAVGCSVSPVSGQYRAPFALVQHCVPQGLTGSIRFDFTTSGVWTANQLFGLQIGLQWVASNAGGGGGCNAPQFSSGPGTCVIGPP